MPPDLNKRMLASLLRANDLRAEALELVEQLRGQLQQVKQRPERPLKRAAVEREAKLRKQVADHAKTIASLQAKLATRDQALVRLQQREDDLLQRAKRAREKTLRRNCALEAAHLQLAAKNGDVRARRRAADLHPVLARVVEVFDVRVSELLASSRCRPDVARARHAACWLLMRSMSSPEAGHVLARHHTTVLYGRTMAENRRQVDPVFASRLDVCMAKPKAVP